MSALDDMIAEASHARDRAYVPYSGFAVGACLRGESGRLYAGCNVENASYPYSLCAEAVALGALIAGGDRHIVEAVIVADGEELITPCGGCRQRISEFAAPGTPVHLCAPDGVKRTVTVEALLPLAFSRGQMRPVKPSG